MAGTNADFDASAFRTAIRAAMNMGAPGPTELQATFRWPEQKTFGTASPAGNPYDWTATPSSETDHDDVTVPVAVKLSETSMTGTDVGSFQSAKATITVLDVDYADIVGATEVLLGGKTYDIVSIPMPEALFEVTVYTIFAEARSAA